MCAPVSLTLGGSPPGPIAAGAECFTLGNVSIGRYPLAVDAAGAVALIGTEVSGPLGSKGLGGSRIILTNAGSAGGVARFIQVDLPLAISEALT